MKDAAHGAGAMMLIAMGATPLPTYEAWLRIGSLIVGITLGLLAIRDRIKNKK